jgi:hypothetical protein
MTEHRLKAFGWGRENEALTPYEEACALRTYQTLFGASTSETVQVPTLDALVLRVPRLTLLRPWPASAPPRAATAPHTPSANPIRTPFSDIPTRQPNGRGWPKPERPLWSA